MTLPRPIAFLFSALVLATAAAAEPLAEPLRKFDKDKDGKLTGDELVKARQSHRRGGREAEPSSRKWKEILDRIRGGWEERNQSKFDRDGKGLSPEERKEMEAVWKRTAERLTALRDEILRKYDRNDDGELNDAERSASRPESERRRLQVEQEELAAAGKAGNAAPAPPAPSEKPKEKRTIPPPRP